jgi:ADP-ribose pyrophosphatase YjhB (NUDIX family)
MIFRLVEAIDARLRARAPVPVQRAAYRIGYQLLRPWWRITRPRTHGVKVVVRCGERVLVVRHAYARRHLWDLPGGFVRGEEDPADAALREIREELGIVDVEAVVSLGATPSRADGKREVIHAFRVDVADDAVVPDIAELADVRWVARDQLPPGAMASTRRLVARASWELWDSPVPAS